MPDRKRVHRFAHEAMATVFEIFIAGKGEAYAGQAARAAFDEIDRIERLFSRFDPSSEVSRISRLRPGESLRVGIETIQVLGLASFLQSETDGAFDPNYRAAAAHSPRRPASPPRSLASLIRAGHTGRCFEVVRLRTRGGASTLDLDLGAVGKGFALDCARGVLSDWGVANALLHAGTSTALGTGPGPEDPGRARGWRVGAGSTAGSTAGPGRVHLRNAALSGSGTEVKGEHIVDPRTGGPARGHPAAWAMHASAAAADALSTAFMVLETEGVADFCLRHPEVWALVKIGPETCRIFNAGAMAGRPSSQTRRRR